VKRTLAHPFARRENGPRSVGPTIPIGLLLIFFACGARANSVEVPRRPTQSGISITDYRARLQSLDQIVATCQHAMIPANCKSEQVGPDIQLSISQGVRQIRFAWLREVLDEAAKDKAAKNETGKSQADKDKAANKKVAQAQPPETQHASSNAAPLVPEPRKSLPEFQLPTLSQQLQDARNRLAADFNSAAQIQISPQWQAQPQSSSGDSANAAPVTPQRQMLARILAAKEYHPAVVGPSLMQRALEKIGNWLDRIIGELQRAGFKSKWIGHFAETSFVLALCVALVWFLIRLERQGRLRSGFLPPGVGFDSPSARDWQLWIQDARNAASQGAWRDAIHLLYWASISHLELSGAWPADRARTPREYVALVSPDSGQRSGLVTLTRNFERTWYGGRPAAEVDFRYAEQLAAQLGAKSADTRAPGKKGAQ